MQYTIAKTAKIVLRSCNIFDILDLLQTVYKINFDLIVTKIKNIKNSFPGFSHLISFPYIVNKSCSFTFK